MARLSHVANSIAVGDKFGRWTVTGDHHRLDDGSAVFPVMCGCGTTKSVRLKYLRNGQSRSCGCLQRETATRVHTTHGRSKDHRFAWLWKTYGITPEDFDDMYDRQLGRCPVCHHTLAEDKLCVDHDHETGLVRGLLCKSCNIGIGHFFENIDSLHRAISYLEEWGK